MKGYIVLSQAGNILCTDGDWHSPSLIGPGCQWGAKVFKTETGAERARVRLGRVGKAIPHE